MISFLWAQDQKGIIGKNNQLPWRLPEDLKYFKEITMGHSIVMGRKTYESIGKPLPGRENIIVTRDPDFQAEGCLIFQTKSQLKQWIDERNDEVFITGGSEIFGLFMEEVDRLYVTQIYEDIEGDTYFPIMDWQEWKLVSRQKGPRNEQNPFDYEFKVFERI